MWMRRPGGDPFRTAAAFLLAAACAQTGRFAAAAEAPIPVQAFFANDQIANVELSPSGHRVALVAANKSGRRVLAVMDVDLLKPPIVVADSPDVDIREFWWLNDDRLVYTVVNLREGGSEQTVGGLFSVKPDGSEPRTVFFSGRRAILSVPRIGGDSIILGRYQFDGVRDLVAVHPERMMVPANQQRPLLPPGYPGHAKRWIFDRSGDARAVQTSFAGVTEAFYRERGKDTWLSIGKWPELEAPWYPHSVDETGRLYVVVTPAESTSYLTRFDFATGQPEPTPIVSTPGFDFEGRLLFEDEGQRLLGVRVNTDAETTVWLDPVRKKLQDIADARFPGLINRTACSRCGAGGVMLVYSYSDRDPGVFSLYRPETSAWTTIGRRRPAIDPRQMAVLDLHRIKARDGLDLPVWVTMPPGQPKSARAAVVLVHGGPWLRGTHWRWDAEAQFLASRGYVVIEPEFRGGRGFGQRHLTSGFRQWGTTMQDDVADAVRWAIDKGWVDDKRVCIAGGSYGGYATLMGAIRYPELYRCGAAWVAVTDPRLMFEDLWVSDIGREAKEYSMMVMIGDPVKDAAMLRAASPVERAAEIKAPILMAFGIQDRRVPLDHGKRMRAAMRAAGQDPEYILYDGEGHGWFKVENRVDFWQRVEKFLAKNLN